MKANHAGTMQSQIPILSDAKSSSKFPRARGRREVKSLAPYSSDAKSTSSYNLEVAKINALSIIINYEQIEAYIATEQTEASTFASSPLSTPAGKLLDPIFHLS